MLNRILTIVGGNPTERDLTKYKNIAAEIDALESDYQSMSDSELCANTQVFREKFHLGLTGIDNMSDRLQKESEIMDDILIQAFATVREASVRTIGLRHYPVQLIGGQVMHAGRIAEMRTGEGKTLVATLPLYLNALSGRGAHLVTVNDYLARRDAKWMGPIFDFLGMSVGILQDASRTDNAQMAYLFDPMQESSQEETHHVRLVSRHEAYEADITYGTNNEFGFDYLRDNIANRLEDRRQRELNYAIIDEVDNVLIDSARTPLIISGPAQDDPKMYIELAKVVRQLKSVHYEIDDRSRSISITDDGYDKVEELLGKTLRDPDNPEDITLEQAQIQSHLEQALRAEFIFKRNKDYLVRSGRVVIVDDFTGRVMPGRRWSDGLHQAVEAKEGVVIQAENVTYATITLQNYFRMYSKLSGMSGTAVTEAEEFDKIYHIDVVPIPTHLDYRAQADPELTEVFFKESGSKFSYVAYQNDLETPVLHRRKDYDDLVFRTAESKLRALTREVLVCNVVGQPLLIGTTSVESSERLAMRFRAQELKKLALVLILRDAWFQKYERDEDGRAVPELVDLNLSIEDMKNTHMRSLSKELDIRLNATTLDNVGRLLKILDIEVGYQNKLIEVLENGIACQVLNAKKHDEESRIIARAGALGSVTIATNMAGRGVDIKLGGELSEETLANVNRVLKRSGCNDVSDITNEKRSELLESLSDDDYGIYGDEIESFATYIEDEKMVRKLGGLHVVGSERHEARRIDNQLRGRASRQGDPGSSRFYLSLEDELMRRFGGANVSKLMERLNIDEAMPIEHGIVNKSIEQSQTRVEGANFDVRKHLLEYDDVLNVQRTKFYEQRDRIFSKDDLRDDIVEMLNVEVQRRVNMSYEDEEGWWRLLTWLDNVQPTLQGENDDLFFSFSIELLLEHLGNIAPGLGHLLSDQTNLHDEQEFVDRESVIQAMLTIARHAADLALERMLIAYNVEIDNLEYQISKAVSEKCELAEMSFEGIVQEARESSQAINIPIMVKSMYEMAGVEIHLDTSQITELDYDNVKDYVCENIGEKLSIDLLTKFVGRVGNRTGLDFKIDIPVWSEMDWHQWKDEFIESLSIAKNDHFDTHINDIEIVLGRQLGEPNNMSKSDWGRLILDMAYSKDVVFHEKSHQRLIRMEQRFPYVYYGAKLLEGMSVDELTGRVTKYLLEASDMLAFNWGQREIRRISNEKLSEFDDQTKVFVREEVGDSRFDEVNDMLISNMDAELRVSVGRGIGLSIMVRLYRQLLLSISSQLWVDYLTSMEALRTSVGLEAYAQRDPLTAYKSKAFDLFRQLLIDMRSAIVSRMFTSTPMDISISKTDDPMNKVEPPKDLGRNDMCWCGSGKKFKNCHMKA